MRALVTGGAGFVGANLIRRLLDDGHNVDSYDNYITGKKENEQRGCEYYHIDIAKDKFRTQVKYDVIFHMAALARIQPSIKNPVNCLNNNFNGTLNILEYARQNNIQVIYAGSSSKHVGLYGSPYAWSKYGGEELCKLYSGVYDLNTTICRFYNVYGKYQIKEGAYATVLGIFENQYLNGESLTITSDGEQRRDFTHVDDIVDALIKCVGRDFRAEEFEIGSGINYSINELAKMFGDTYPTKYLPKRSGEYDTSLCIDRKANEMLDWEVKNNIETYVEKWLGENK